MMGPFRIWELRIEWLENVPRICEACKNLEVVAQFSAFVRCAVELQALNLRGSPVHLLEALPHS